MDIGAVLSVAQTLFSALQCKELQDIFSFLGYKSQLEDLQRSVKTVTAVLRDAETKELSHEAQDYIEKLKDAVYDADDLFDRFATLAKQKQLIKGDKVSKKVRRFFNRHNPLSFAYTMSQGAKEVRKKLDAIASDHKQFGFSIDPQPIKLRKEETCSYVYQNDIVGREDDVNDIVGHLLGDSNTQQVVSFLSVVGMGGLGKTALAQLVFNDPRLTQGESAFPLMIWTCVGDLDTKQLDVLSTLRKILNSVTNKEYGMGSTLEFLQSEVQQHITSKKYLLVLDDVWTEDLLQWRELAKFFLGGKVKGSWIVVTTRSHETARIIGHGPKHELQGLSSENSWCLFHKIAFSEKEQSATPDEDLVRIGQEIVEACAGVPLAIRVAGSLLYGQHKSKWLSFQKAGLTNFKESQSNIKHILKFSYHQLESSLKSCFTYCALFPKDYEFYKEDLLSLWIAQGYVVPLVDGQTVEEAAEEYFSILLRRCFFQDIYRNEYYRIICFKLHDLMHDYALDVAEKEICVINFPSNINMDKKVRHVGYASDYFAEPPFTKNRVRSYCYIGNWLNKRPQMVPSTLEALLSNSMCLRSLDLNGVGLISLPKFIGELLHLRYLDISENDKLEALPKSIENLCNLQTIKIGGCSRLKELPKDFIKSVNYNLRILEISECGIEYLNCAGTLPNLKSLTLDNLVELEYIILNDSTEDGCLFLPSLEELYLENMPNLKGWRDPRVRVGDAGSCSSITRLLSFPQLNFLDIYHCKEMKCNLVCPKLDILKLNEFNEELQVRGEMRRKVGDEQITEARSSSTRNISSSFSYGVPKLRIVATDNVRWLNRMPMESFQCLVHLSILENKELESLGDVEGVLRSCSSSLKTLHLNWCHELRRVMSGGLEHLTCLEQLRIDQCGDLEEEDWNKDGTLMPKLETLDIYNFQGWKAMPEWIPKLSSLKSLKIRGCSIELKQRCENPNGEDWPLIQHIPLLLLFCDEGSHNYQ